MWASSTGQVTTRYSPARVIGAGKVARVGNGASTLYPFHVAASRDAELPSLAELTTIEADSPEEALAKLPREPLMLSGGLVKTVWLNVVVSVWPNGNARQVMRTEVAVEAIHRSN